MTRFCCICYSFFSYLRVGLCCFCRSYLRKSPQLTALQSLAHSGWSCTDRYLQWLEEHNQQLEGFPNIHFRDTLTYACLLWLLLTMYKLPKVDNLTDSLAKYPLHLSPALFSISLSVVNSFFTASKLLCIPNPPFKGTPPRTHSTFKNPQPRDLTLACWN